MTVSPGFPQAIEGEAESFLVLDLDDFGIVDENLNRPIVDSVERGPDGLLDFRHIQRIELLGLIHIVGLSNDENA